MTIFETRIVKVWQPAKWFKTLVSILLLLSASIVFIWDPEITWLRITGYIVYFLTFLLTLSTSFIRPKDLGIISISEDQIKVKYKGKKASFKISELKELGLNDRGYAGFWMYFLQSNKHHLYFTDRLDDLYDLEIVIQNREKEEDLKQFLNNLPLVYK